MLIVDSDDVRIFKSMFAHSSVHVRSNMPLIFYVFHILEEKKVDAFCLWKHVAWENLHESQMLPEFISVCPWPSIIVSNLKFKNIPLHVVGPEFLEAALNRLTSEEVLKIFDDVVPVLSKRENLEYALQTPALYDWLGTKKFIEGMPSAWLQDKGLMESIYTCTDSFNKCAWRPRILMVAFYCEELALRYLEQDRSKWTGISCLGGYFKGSQHPGLWLLTTTINSKEIAFACMDKFNPSAVLSKELLCDRDVILAIA